jgi:hypothetical protein
LSEIILLYARIVRLDLQKYSKMKEITAWYVGKNILILLSEGRKRECSSQATDKEIMISFLFN